MALSDVIPWFELIQLGLACRFDGDAWGESVKRAHVFPSFCKEMGVTGGERVVRRGAAAE